MMFHIKSVYLLNIMLKTLFVSYIHTLILSSRASIYFLSKLKADNFLVLCHGRSLDPASPATKIKRDNFNFILWSETE